METLMNVKARVKALSPYIWTLAFSSVAVWGVLLNGALVSNQGPLHGYEFYVFLAVCSVAAIVFFVLSKPFLGSRIWVAVVSIIVGVGMPVLSIAVPLIFCIAFQCKDFVLP
jgi:hypothetical protein